MDNNYAQLALAADVRIGGTVAAPTLLGRAEARDGGRIFLGGNVYQIDGAGVIDFSNPSRIEPDLGITALARWRVISVKLNLKGTPATLETTLTSDPPLSQGEIVSLLVTGQKDSGGAWPSAAIRSSDYLSGEVLGVTGRALGLDALRVERGQDVRFDAGLVATETDPSSRLTFGKQVTRTVEVVFSQSLKDSGKLTWIIGYRPKPSIELRFVSQDNESRIYDFRHDVTIGDVDGARRRSRGRSRGLRRCDSPARRACPRMALRDRLRLTEGKVFDFYRWQQDRDRLEGALRQDGHFEARVSARRSGSQADAARPSISPTTSTEVHGRSSTSRASRTSERFAASWSVSGPRRSSTAFSLEEARNAVRAAMIRDGYVRATVTTAIDRKNGGDEKHLVVQRRARTAILAPPAASSAASSTSARPGSRSWRGSRRLAVGRPGAARQGHHDDVPQRGVSRRRGHGGRASSSTAPRQPCPSRSAKVRCFACESVAFVGARARTPEAAQKAFGLQPGAALTRAAADAAVQALASAYRADGFNTVRVTLTSQATRGTGLVALTVSIDEGPRQVLRDISTRRRATDEPRARQPRAQARISASLSIGRPGRRPASACTTRACFVRWTFRPCRSSRPCRRAAGADRAGRPDDEAQADEPRPTPSPRRAACSGAGDARANGRRCGSAMGSSSTISRSRRARSGSCGRAWPPTRPTATCSAGRRRPASRCATRRISRRRAPSSPSRLFSACR